MAISLIRVLSDEAILGFNNLRADFGVNRPSFESWLQHAYPDLGKTRELYKIIADGNEVGLLLMHFIEPASAKINALLIYSNFRNKGYGKEALRQAIHVVFSEINWFFGQCREDDHVSLKLLRMLGFVQIGLLKHLDEDATNHLLAYNSHSDFSIDVARKLALDFYKRPNQQIIY